MTSNLNLKLDFKGQGAANGLPAYNPNGVWVGGGIQDPNDAQLALFGCVVNSDPAAAPARAGGDGLLAMGALTQSGVASVYVATISGTSASTTTVYVDGTAISVTSGLEASGLATLIAAATLYRFTATASGVTDTFTSKYATKVSAPTFTDGYPATGFTFTVATSVSGTYGAFPRGVLLFDASISQNDPAKPNYTIQGTPLTFAYKGPVWIQSFIGSTNNVAGSNALAGKDLSGVALTGYQSTPLLNSVVVASNVTGEIGFLATGSSAPSGYSIINATVKSVSLDTSGVLLFLNM